MRRTDSICGEPRPETPIGPAIYNAWTVDANTRRLRYFVAVAQELHFSRAAAKLFIAQQSLSKQISELEAELGVALLLRTSRRIELTPAGHLFLGAAKESLAAFDAGVSAAQRTGRGQQGVLKLGFSAGAAMELSTPILAEFGRRYPHVRLDLHEYAFDDPSAGLVSSSSDVAFVRLPIAPTDLATEILFSEPCVLAVRTGHPLSDRDTVHIADILDEPIAVGRTNDAAWRDFWTLTAYRNGKPPSQIIETSTQSEEIEVVAAGMACDITPIGGGRYSPRPGVSLVPIVDAPRSVLAVAWRHNAMNPLVEQFVAVATSVRDTEQDIIRAIEEPAARE
jgi:DNA-binding transcriptional LysR family regulator